MPAKRRFTPQEEEVFRILNGFSRRKQLLSSLEREHSALTRRMTRLIDHPEDQAADLPPLPGGFSWSGRTVDSLDHDLRLLVQEQQVYDALLDCLDPFERRIVRLRHEKNKSWCAVARMVYLCERQAQRIYRAAIRRLGLCWGDGFSAGQCPGPFAAAKR